MPNLDGRGPKGEGPNTGQGLGNCEGSGRLEGRGRGPEQGNGMGRGQETIEQEEIRLRQRLHEIEALKTQ